MKDVCSHGDIMTLQECQDVKVITDDFRMTFGKLSDLKDTDDKPLKKIKEELGEAVTYFENFYARNEEEHKSYRMMIEMDE